MTRSPLSWRVYTFQIDTDLFTFQYHHGITPKTSPHTPFSEIKPLMENLNLHDAAPRPLSSMQNQMPPGPPPVPQLPPQMFTTAAQLLDLTDKKLMVSLRDGRKLIGVLRSWDQFGLSPPFKIQLPQLYLYELF